MFLANVGGGYDVAISNGTFLAVARGQPADLAAVGDFDGDGKTDIAVWRNSDGIFYVIDSSTGQPSLSGSNELGRGPFGAAGDVALAYVPEQ